MRRGFRRSDPNSRISALPVLVADAILASLTRRNRLEPHSRTATSPWTRSTSASPPGSWISTASTSTRPGHEDAQPGPIEAPDPTDRARLQGHRQGQRGATSRRSERTSICPQVWELRRPTSTTATSPSTKTTTWCGPWPSWR